MYQQINYEVQDPIATITFNRPVAGMGLSIAMFSDLRFAAEDAFFTTAFGRLGLVAELALSWTLSQAVGPSVALDLLWSSRKIDGREAYRLGLANYVLPDDELIP